MSILNPFSRNYLPAKGLTRVENVDVPRSFLVTTDEAKTHLRILHNDDDTYITSLTKAAQLTAEYYINRDLTTCNWLYKCDVWEQSKTIPYSGVKTITKIEYYNDNGVLTTWQLANYYLDTSIFPNRICLHDNKEYPTLRDGIGNVHIYFNTTTKDFGGNLELAKQAVLIMIADMYENRQSVIVGRIASSIPKTSGYLLDTLKIQTV
mgnify:CR=1 FL=1|tara:strand:+ start:6733 stop:7353 length:621 start_codon:yes stop_codon:yes gene_type:complete